MTSSISALPCRSALGLAGAIVQKVPKTVSDRDQEDAIRDEIG